ncbi:AF4/FMR2 family member 1 isoform X2 [Eublepharis macularius]|uniref:AF4/FMR2 family member 1 isoform X2 n=1 Tax=Eublepharis macularius TaxID=481883 RepID=A0AA97L8G8_EUBMA|nr:AF4/FMR2 family member 1 isoform X2 [Eublepharis macularius]
MASTNTPSSKNSLYNEERNLRRIQEKERRNQEAHQEREPFPASVPLFGEPYKINKADELSSRIQNMLGSYEEMKEFIATRFHQNLIGIPQNVMSLIPQHQPDRPLFPDKTSNVLPSSFQNSSHHHKPLGPLTSNPSAGCSAHYQKVNSRIEPASDLKPRSGELSGNQKQAPEQICKTQEIQSRRCPKKNEKCIEEDIAKELQASLLELSPLLSTLSSPVAPLSPLHSSQHVSSRSHGSSKYKSHGPKSSPSQDLVAGTCDKESQDSLSGPVAVSSQPSSQTFPPSLPSKTSAIQQKPTAYVRPMDGQDQAPDESPELKPLLEEYHEELYGKIADIKVNSKAKLPALKIPTEPAEQSFSNEVHCVEEILKEMTHSWPPPLTAIHTPSTAEPSKFPFPAKESQHAGSVIQSQKQYDAPSKTLSLSQQGTSTLQEDLLLSDSEDGEDDQVSDKPSSSSTPPSAPQSQPESVALAHSSSPESESTSGSDSSSDSESSDSDSEANDPPTRTSTPEPSLQTSSRSWQLNNWMPHPVSPTENFLEDDRSRCSLQDTKEQGKSFSSGSSSSSDSSKSECPQPTERHSKASGKASQSAPELHLPTKRSYQKSPVHSGRQTVGSKQPKKSSRALVPEEQKGGLKVESEPLGPYGAKDQSSKDKPKVKTKGRPKPGDRKEPKPTALEASEKKKHKTSHHNTVKSFPDHDAAKENVVSSTLEQLPLSPVTQSPRVPAVGRTSSAKPATVAREDLHRDKFLLPIRDKKLLSPLRDHPVPQALVVKIELALLARIPQPGRKGSCPKRLEIKESHDMKKSDADRRSAEMSSNFPKKRKQGDAPRDDPKKMKLEKENKSSSLSSHKDSSRNKVSKMSAETQRKELPLPPVSPTQLAQKPAKTAQKRPKSESGASSQPPRHGESIPKNKESHKDSSSSKHRKMEGKPSETSKSSKGSVEDASNPFPVPSLPNGTSKPTKPQSKPHKQHPVEYHLKEAKRLKHKADATTDKVGKAIKYLAAALSFIECGIAMESDTLTPKPAYTMFAETIDLIKFIMTLKSFADSSTTTHEKIFAVLCMRCQAILYMAMFRYKKDTAIKYSRTLNEHFKSSSRITQAPSPCVARSTGTPSPLSPMPSPASSVSSQTGSSTSSCGGGSGGSSISVPHHIPPITSSFVNITSYILYAYDLWEQADVLARKNKKFFSELSAAVCTLSLNSSMTELVPYTRQGLQWLKLEPNTP